MDESSYIPIKSLAIMHEVETRPAQDILHHYTRRNGLIGILRDRKIWASNARYLNDARELATAEAVAIEMLRVHDFAPDSPEARLFEDCILSFDGLDPYKDEFVFSLSERDDLLSQWRAYGRAGDGYAIGFDVSSLLQIAEASSGYLSKCHYESGDHRRLIGVIIDDAVRRLRQALEKGVERLKAHSEALGVFVAGFQLVAPMIKHEKFAEEEEWRLVLPFFTVWAKTVRYHDGGRLLVPYIPVPLGDGARLVAQVRIGPTPHQRLEERATSGLLTVSGFPDAKVTVSEVPYRAW